jgi:hypothetical protein
MLEWDAALFNEDVKEYDRAMARIKDSISKLSDAQSVGAQRERQRLRQLAASLGQEFLKRAHTFWHGEGA